MPSPSEHRTATFLMTDIEGSTRLWEEHREAMAMALAAHDGMLRAAVERAGGTVVKTTGDGVLAVFDVPETAVAAALDGQRALRDHAWPATGPLRVRMAIHSGSAEAREGDVHGRALNRVARLLAIGHGGQILLSGAAAALVDEGLPAEAELVNRGEHRLRDLSRPEHVFQLEVPDLPRDFPALRSVTPQTNLPVQLTSFIGRERQLAEIPHLLEQHRLVSLVGVGGTGKTRLMLRAADELADRYDDGIWLVELAPISEPGLIAPEVARALGIPDVPGQPAIAVVTDFLRSKELLLLLDNCEHLIEAAADMASKLLANCRSLRIMTTSREALGVSGEAIEQVPSLGLPEEHERPADHDRQTDRRAEPVASTEAVRLFVDRASATMPGFELDESTLASVAEICRRLDGIPLAIELAAARVNVLSVNEIAQRLGDRFRLLTGGRRTAVPRQQTLQALIDWSWDLLGEPDQRLLRRLSAFSGGWTLDASARITTDAEGDLVDARLTTLDGLSRLVDRSLVAVDHAGATRYRMLETIRQYARDRLIASGEAATVRTRHLALFRNLALEAAEHLEGPDLVAWLDRLDAEVDNLRVALDWAHETDVEAALGMSVALGQYWRYRSPGAEGLDRLRQAVDAVATLPPPAATQRAAGASLTSRVLSTASVATATTGGNADTAGDWADRAVTLARESGDRRALSLALTSRALAMVFGGVAPSGDAMEVGREAMAAAEDVGAWSSAAYNAAGMAIYEASRNPASAGAWLERATSAARRSGNLSAVAFTALARGRVLSYGGSLDEARPWFEEALAAFREMRDLRLELSTRSDFAHALRRGGLLGEAAVAYRETMRDWQHFGQRGAIANQLESIGYLALAHGDAHLAATLLGSAEVLREVAGTAMLPMERSEYQSEVGRVRTALDPATFERAWADGRALSTDEAIALAFSVLS